nr:SdrD B-like domain-containing protein [Herbaspirillum sp. ASV7]
MCLLLLWTPAALGQLSVSSAFSQSNIAAGQGSALTFTLRNGGSSPLVLPAFTFNPIGTDVATSSTLQALTSAVVSGSPVSLGTNCPAATVTRINGNQGVLLSATTLAAGASCAISVPFSGTIGVALNKVVTFTPKAASASSGSPAVSVSFAARNSVSVWNNFQITKASSPKLVAAGDPVFFEILINNFAGQTLNGLIVNDRLQSNSAMVSFPGWTGSTGLPTWSGINTSRPAALGGCTVASVAGANSNPVFTLDNVLLNSVCTLGFWGALPKDAAEGATPINSLELGAVSWVNPVSGFTVANASQTSTQMQVVAPLAISAAFGVASSPEGVPVTLTFTLANSSAGTVGNLAFSAALPLTALGKQLRVASPANAATTCTGGSVTAVAGSNTIALSGGSLAPRTINPSIAGKNQASTCTVSVQVIGPADTYTLTLPRQALSGSGNYAVDGSAYTPRSSALVVPAPATLVYNTPILSASKAFAPASVGEGGRSTVTVTLNNNGSGPLLSLALNDPLPPYMTVASPANASSTCSGASLTAVPGAGSVSMSGGNLAASSSCQLVFDVIGSGAAPWVNSIPAGGITASGGIQNLEPVSATLANSTPPAVAVSATLAPATLAMPGQDSVLTIQLQNKSPQALSNLRLSDYFTVNGTATTAPTGMQLLAPFSLSSSCSGAVLNAAGDGGSFSMTGASLPFGGSCTITAHVTTSRSGTVVNVIPVQAVASSEGVSNPGGATVSLTAGGRIDVSKSFTPALVRPGAVSRLRLNLSHTSVAALGGLALTDHLPAGLAVATPANALTTCSGGVLSTVADQVRLAGASMPPAAGLPSTCSVELDVLASSEGRYQNTLQVGDVTGNFDGGPASNWVAAGAALDVRKAVQVSKSFAPSVVARQAPSTATITLVNGNAIDLTALRLVDTLPPNLVPAALPRAATTCPGGSVAVDAAARSVTLNGATLPASGTCQISVDVVSEVPGTYTSSIAAHALQDSEGVDNDLPASATLTVLRPPALTKQFVAPQIRAGGVSTLILALGNDNSSAISLSADLVDALPGGMTVAASPNLGGSCDLAQLSAAAGATTIRYAGGAVLPPGGCTIRVDVTVAAEGSYGNVIAAGALLTTAGSNVLAATASLMANPLGVISGKVFLDAASAPDGIYDGSKPGIAGVVVGLSGTSYGADGAPGGGDDVAVNLQATTDASGSYSFGGLMAGRYTVSLAAHPPNTLTGITSAGPVQGGGGGSSGTASAVTAWPSSISGIVILVDASGRTASSASNNFAVLAQASVAGRVYADGNNNGVVDAGEAGIANVTVQLAGTDWNGNAVTRSTLTAADGRYQFDKLPPSNAAGYTITEIQPAGYLDGKTSVPPGKPGVADSSKPAAAGGMDAIHGVVVLAGDLLGDYHFAEVPTLSIAGRVFIDRNNNGIADAGETGIANVTIRLGGKDIAGNGVQLSTLTGTDGVYRFDKLPPSDASGYSLTEIQPVRYPDGLTRVPPGQPGLAEAAKPVAAGGADVIRGIVARAGDMLADYNFAELASLVLQLPVVSGYVYFKADQGGARASDQLQAGMAGWTAQLTQNGAPVCSVQSNAQGFYQFDNLHCPGYEDSGLPSGSGFAITFLTGGKVVSTTASSGNRRGDVSVLGKITGITLLPDERVVEQNLPLDPSGVVYDAQTRQPVAGATVTLSGPAGFDPARHLVGGQARQVTGVNGFYQFLLQGGFPPGQYRLAVQGPPSYQQGTAASMPPCQGDLTVAALPAPARVQASDNAPGVAVPVANPAACVGILTGGAASTQYYLGFVLSDTSAPVLNNHLPLDKAAAGLLTVFKSTPMMRAARGDLVPYSITVINNQAHPVGAVNLLDQMPPGFKYRRGSAFLDHVPLEPVMSGRVMVWRGQNFQANEKKTYRLILVVGAGVEPGDYINQAWAISVDNRLLSGVAQASTRVVAEPTLDCPELVGKVFEDRNGNGYQDPGEPGLAGVRLVTPRGVLIHTDAQGRFHVPCPELPNPDRGSNFVLKLDTRTLPEGYRVSTDNPASVRLTRGKVSKISFGAVRYRILRLNLGDAAFVPGLSDLLPQWDAQLDALVERLLEAPSIMLLQYMQSLSAQPPGLDLLRLQALRERLLARWQARQGPYLLRIEIASQR